MFPSKIYVCITDVPNSIFRVGTKIFLYEKDLGKRLEQLLESRTNYFILVKDNVKK
jgi:hypothetical protein